MIIKALHFSDHFSNEQGCNEIEIEVSVYPTAEDDFEFEIECLWDKHAEVGRKLEDFPKEEQDKIERAAERAASESDVHGAWYEEQSSRAYDSWKDRMKYGDD